MVRFFIMGVFTLQEFANFNFLDFLRYLVLFFQKLIKLVVQLHRFIRSENALRNQLFGINISWARMFFNGFIKQWLSESGFISFVMAVFAVTQNIDKNIRVKFLPEFHSQFHCKNYSFNIVAIYVKNRRTGYLCHVGAIRTRPCIEVIGGKTNLVIDYQMNRSTGFVSGQLRHLYNFINNSLRCNGCIAMNNNRRYFIKVIVVI